MMSRLFALLLVASLQCVASQEIPGAHVRWYFEPGAIVDIEDRVVHTVERSLINIEKRGLDDLCHAVNNYPLQRSYTIVSRLRVEEVTKREVRLSWKIVSFKVYRSQDPLATLDAEAFVKLAPALERAPEFKVRVEPNTRVLAIDGYDDFLKTLKVTETPLAGFIDEYLHSFLPDNPDEELHFGNKWTREGVVTFPFGKLEARHQYRYEGRRGDDLDRIAVGFAPLKLTYTPARLKDFSTFSQPEPSYFYLRDPVPQPFRVAGEILFHSRQFRPTQIRLEYYLNDDRAPTAYLTDQNGVKRYSYAFTNFKAKTTRTIRFDTPSQKTVASPP